MKIKKISNMGIKNVVTLEVTTGSYVSHSGVINHNCKYCRHLWLMPDGTTPKLYKMSELSATPGNDYKNPKPSIAVTHPVCRCVLVPLMPGFAHEDGKTIYKGTDPETGRPYDAYAKQKTGK